MVNQKKTKYFKTYKIEDLDTVFHKYPTKEWIETKLLYCFELTSLTDTSEISNDSKKTILARVKLLTDEIVTYLQVVMVKRSFCKYENTLYKCIIILKYFANLYGYTVQRRFVNLTPYKTKIYYSLVSTKYLRDCDYIQKTERKKYTHKPLFILPEYSKLEKKIEIKPDKTIYKKHFEPIKISFD